MDGPWGCYTEFLNLLNRSSEGEQVKQMLKNGAEISDVWNHIAYNSDIYA